MTSFLRINSLSTLTLFSLLSTLISPSLAIPSIKREGDKTVKDVLTLKSIASRGVTSYYSVTSKINDEPFELLIDTGNAVTWIAHKKCDVCREAGMKTIDVDIPDNCGAISHPKYSYGGNADPDRDIRGCMVDVSLTFGGSKLNKYPIFVVTKMGRYLHGTTPKSQFSGRLGIGAFNATWQDQVPIMKTMVDEGLFDDIKEVGLYMPAKAGVTGRIIIGDSSQFGVVDQNKVVAMPNIAEKKEKFEILVDSIKVNGAIVAEKVTARLDSSQTGIYYPIGLQKEIRSNLYSEPNANPFGGVGCDNIQTLTFTIDGHEFTINSEDLAHKAEPGEAEGGECVADVRPYHTYVDYWVFGTGFFHNVYSSFNVEKGEVKIFELKS